MPSLQANVIMLGVKDVDRAKKFYVEGMGCQVEQDYPGFVRCRLGDRSADLALYAWDAVAQDAGVPAEGSGFRGVSFHVITDTRDEVDALMRAAAAAGGTADRGTALSPEQQSRTTIAPPDTDLHGALFDNAHYVKLRCRAPSPERDTHHSAA